MSNPTRPQIKGVSAAQMRTAEETVGELVRAIENAGGIGKFRNCDRLRDGACFGLPDGRGVTAKLNPDNTLKTVIVTVPRDKVSDVITVSGDRPAFMDLAPIVKAIAFPQR